MMGIVGIRKRRNTARSLPQARDEAFFGSQRWLREGGERQDEHDGQDAEGWRGFGEARKLRGENFGCLRIRLDYGNCRHSRAAEYRPQSPAGAGRSVFWEFFGWSRGVIG